MPSAGPIRLRESVESGPLGAEIYDLVDRAFRGPPHPSVEPRSGFLDRWTRQVARAGFRLLTVEEPGRGIIGFLYGYRGKPGTWWFDRVVSAISAEARQRWLDDPFEIVSLAVDPGFRGQGLGSALLQECLAVASTRSAVLSTHRDRNPAVRLYLRHGFEVIHPGLVLGPDGPPFVVMGREILPRRT